MLVRGYRLTKDSGKMGLRFVGQGFREVLSAFSETLLLEPYLEDHGT